MLEPTGVFAMSENKTPIIAQNTAMITAQTLTFRKLLNTLIADSAGNMTRAEINSVPTRFIAITTTTAIMTASIRLYVFALTPVAAEKSSSNVIAKIL